MVLVKLSSLGRTGRNGERAHLQYINRYGTLEDEVGNSLAVREALELHDFSRKTTSYHVVVSLPIARYDYAVLVVKQILARRYPYFVCALHLNDNGEKLQPHLHISVIARGHDRLQRMDEIFLLRDEIDKAFHANGLNYSPARTQSTRPRLSPL